jgi:hypothetical protein
MLTRSRATGTLVAALALLAALTAAIPTAARASTSQISIIEPGPLLDTNPSATLHTLRLLGTQEIRLVLHWNEIAPSPLARKQPRGFNASNPADYPASQWASSDAIISDAKSVGIGIDLDIDGRAPLWAMPRNAPAVAQGSLDPSASDYQAFVQAVGKRYSGSYTPSGSSAPLPKVSFWSVWNEPNYVSSLGPQGSGHNNVNPVSPGIYRNLVDAAWKGLGASGHGHDKILIGELAARGYPDDDNGLMFPVLFVRSLYCVGSSYRELRGASASAQRCPTTAAGSARFRSENPGLFDASGFSDHPYSRNYPPNREEWRTCNTGLCASLGDIGDLTSALDRSQRAYGSNRKLSVYNTEYGPQTGPPKHGVDGEPFVSQATAAAYINWAEYLSFKNPRIASYDQYLLADPEQPDAANDNGDANNYASGLESWNGTPKPGYYAYRLPLFLPKTRGHSLEVWGDARPAPFASLDTGGAAQTVKIQFAPGTGSTFTTAKTVTLTNSMGYFDTHVSFPGAGTVRLTYTYPASDMMLAPGYTIYSRHVAITGG